MKQLANMLNLVLAHHAHQCAFRCWDKADASIQDRDLSDNWNWLGNMHQDDECKFMKRYAGYSA